MENYTIDNDITVYCLAVTPFPGGLPEVWNRMHATYAPGNGRSYYGISWGDGKGGILYKAAVSIREDDIIPGGDFEPFIIKKGSYRGTLIRDFMSDTRLIGQTFQQLLQAPDVAADGYCLEIYLNPKDVRCLIKLNDQ